MRLLPTAMTGRLRSEETEKRRLTVSDFKTALVLPGLRVTELAEHRLQTKPGA